MVEYLSIENFKSIKRLELKTTRVNVFIGEHNSGKSNIIEALSWFSSNAFEERFFSEFFRFKLATDFFYDFDATQSIKIKTNISELTVRYAKNKNGALLNQLEGIIIPPNSGIDIEKSEIPNVHGNLMRFDLSFEGKVRVTSGNPETPFRTYIFKKLKEFGNNFRPFLNPPFGENIPSLLISNKKLKDRVSDIFREKGFRLMLKPIEGDMNMAKDVNDELYSYPYTAISETLQRIVFFVLAIESNKDATISLDEPDSNTFPMYTKQLAELIALDNHNQYFIATHNPYLLNSLVSKTPSKDLSVFVTEMQKYQTKVTSVKGTALSKVLDSGADIYFNLNKLTGK